MRDHESTDTATRSAALRRLLKEERDSRREMEVLCDAADEHEAQQRAVLVEFISDVRRGLRDLSEFEAVCRA